MSRSGSPPAVGHAVTAEQCIAVNMTATLEIYAQYFIETNEKNIIWTVHLWLRQVRSEFGRRQERLPNIKTVHIERPTNKQH
jgi:hypothetical protein